jgi:hypothetical protein
MVNIIRLLTDQGLTKSSHDLLLIVRMNTLQKGASSKGHLTMRV